MRLPDVAELTQHADVSMPTVKIVAGKVWDAQGA